MARPRGQTQSCVCMCLLFKIPWLGRGTLSRDSRGVVDNVLFASPETSVQGAVQALIIFHCPHISTAYLRRGGGGGVQGYLLYSHYFVPLGLAWVSYISIPGVVLLCAKRLSNCPAAR